MRFFPMYAAVTGCPNSLTVANSTNCLPCPRLSISSVYSVSCSAGFFVDGSLDTNFTLECTSTGVMTTNHQCLRKKHNYNCLSTRAIK